MSLAAPASRTLAAEAGVGDGGTGGLCKREIICRFSARHVEVTHGRLSESGCRSWGAVYARVMLFSSQMH